ncbi:MAG TPA: Coenzyme F420 hydrogenase/dehydrogenase, beta subunit C-terminal domain [Kiritimatiellia bacterium]|jgi:coenzyme F420-reducing hydrogenase beta subunit|nr:Coenzyme F420 hydrogenase/dehydrogenase, beta subunit C-terminal domain [Kiritimatiellia bacterium]
MNLNPVHGDENTQPLLLCATEDCTGCSACSAICPESCVALLPDREGFLRPHVDSARCLRCGLCTKICPGLHPGLPAREPVAVYAAQNTCAAVREESSSGGVFSLLAERVLERGGVVFGAGCDATFRVVHQEVEDAADLARLRGSKYVQSDMNDIFRRVRQHLGAGRQVLFSGSPCQVAGLRAFLGKVFDRLLCVDFVCHGVPSPRVFELWKRRLEKRSRSAITGISFRNKACGWRQFSFAATFADGRTYRETVKEELYLRGFLSNLFLRPACHACRFKEMKSGSDLTLADYWGVEKRFPCFRDNRGTSLVLANSAKGVEAFRSCASGVEFRDSDYAHAVACNPSIVRSSRPHPDRARFFARLETHELGGLLLRMAKLSFRRRVKLFVKHALGMI